MTNFLIRIMRAHLFVCGGLVCLVLSISIAHLGCKEGVVNPSNTTADAVLGVRSTINQLVFGNGISRVAVYDSTSGEYIYTISSDFEVQPYGDTNWYAFSATKKIKVKCNCVHGCSGGAGTCWGDVSSQASTVATCENNCPQPCECKMRIRLTNTTDDITIAEYEGGAEVKLQ